MAETYTYDSGGAGSLPGGGDPDYSSLATWESATDNDLSSIGISTLECYDSQNHDDNVYVNGATNTDATHYRVIKSSASCSTPFAGRRGTGANFVYDGNAQTVLKVNESFSRFSDICVRYNGSYANVSHGIYLYSGHSKALNCVVFDCKNNNASYTSYGIYVRDYIDNPLVYNCIVYGGDGNGIRVKATSGRIEGVICCTSIKNAGTGILSNDSSGTAIVWSCYAADNTTADFSAYWDSPSGWCGSKDTSAESVHADNNYKSLDLTSTGLDSFANETTGSEDYTLTESAHWDNGADQRCGRNPYDDVTATCDFDDFFKNDTNGEAISKKDIEGNDRPTPDTADTAWDVGASQYVAAGETYTVTKASLTSTGKAVSTSIDVTETIIKEALVWTGEAVTASIDVTEAIAKTSFSWTGKAITTAIDTTETVGKASLAWTGKAVTAVSDVIKTITKASLAWTGKAIYASTAGAVVISRAILNWTGKNVFANQMVNIGKGALVYTGKAITTSVDIIQEIGKVTLSWTGKAVSTITPTIVQITKMAILYIGRAIYFPGMAEKLRKIIGAGFKKLIGG